MGTIQVKGGFVPVVPRLEDQVGEAALPSARVSPEAPLSAFGGGDALNLLSDKQNKGLEMVQEMAKEAKHQADQIAILDYDKKLSSLQTNLEFNPQTGFKNRRGKDALDAQDATMKSWQAGVEELDSTLSNDAQRMAASKLVNSRFKDLNRSLQSHVSGELQRYDTELTNSYLDNERDAAAQNFTDPNRISLSLTRQSIAAHEYAQRNGLPNEWADKTIRDAVSKTHASVIERFIANGDGLGAKEYFNTVKGEMSADQQVKSQTQMEREVIIGEGAKAWVQFGGYRLQDGTPDVSRMEASINERKDLNDGEKIKVIDYLKARAGEDIQNAKRIDAANERDFFNQVIQDKQNGGSLESAQRLVNQFSKDEYDGALKTKAIQEMYAPPSQSDPSTYINIWEKAQAGSASKAEIDQAFKNNKLNQGDWRGLREKLFSSQLEGNSADEKYTWDRIKSLAEQKIGSKVDRENFMYVVHMKAKGKSSEEAFKIATDELGKDPNTGWLGMFKATQFKTDMQKMDAGNLAWGKLKQDLGDNVVNAIGAGALYSGKSSWGPQDVNEFAQSFNGYDNIKPGTPVNNAMQSLINHRAIVTPANVNAVLKKYPDGRY